MRHVACSAGGRFIQRRPKYFEKSVWPMRNCLQNQVAYHRDGNHCAFNVTLAAFFGAMVYVALHGQKMAGNIILNCSSILLNSKQSPSVISSPWPTAKDAKHARPHPDLCCISSKTSLNVHFTSQILSSRSPVRMKWQLAISSTYCSTLITKIPGNNVQSQTSHFCVDGELLPSVTQILASANQTRTKKWGSTWR